MISESLPNSFFKYSATFCVQRPNSFIFLLWQTGQDVGMLYCVLQMWQSPIVSPDSIL